MSHLCDFCGEQRSVIYCRSDAAALCLSCDRIVHSANALSRRHSRTLLCDRCSTQPAFVRCIEESVSLCQNCDWNEHGGSAVAKGHKRETINCYIGCPSAAELSRMWPFFKEFPPIEDADCGQGLGLMTIDENSVTNCWGHPENSNSGAGKLNNPGAFDKFDSLIGSSSGPAICSMPCTADLVAGSVDSTTPKVHLGFSSLYLASNFRAHQWLLSFRQKSTTNSITKCSSTIQIHLLPYRLDTKS